MGLENNIIIDTTSHKKGVLSFDLVISFEDEVPLETINKIKEQVALLITDYQIVINYDQDFSLS